LGAVAAAAAAAAVLLQRSCKVLGQGPQGVLKVCCWQLPKPCKEELWWWDKILYTKKQ
jgi:hypothetical protein